MDSQWRKASYSNAGSDCVECRSIDGRTVQVRDTVHRELGHLDLPSGAWVAFLAEAGRM
ncbi:DUF397 domain-containing protein [Nocardiopsis mangrovi]|uniref:DUF397 domain-containing protein n=1 Tax=Nocardiopsis mangrovi TaxID=1179818 RepID=A0ABV9DTN9_9ACTN